MTPRISGRQIAAWLGPGDRRAIVLTAGLGWLADLALHGGWAAQSGSWLLAGLTALPFALLCAAAAAIVIIDLRHHRIPDRLSLPLIPLGLIHGALTDPLLPRLGAMALVWAGLTALQQVFLWLRGKPGLGGGDLKLMTAAAAWLPAYSVPFYVLAAAITGLIQAAMRPAHRDKPIAFGAHLAPWLALFVLFA